MEQIARSLTPTQSEDLKDALLELEWIGGASIELTMSDEDPYFVLQCIGSSGSGQVIRGGEPHWCNLLSDRIPCNLS